MQKMGPIFVREILGLFCSRFYARTPKKKTIVATLGAHTVVIGPPEKKCTNISLNFCGLWSGSIFFLQWCRATAFPCKHYKDSGSQDAIWAPRMEPRRSATRLAASVTMCTDRAAQRVRSRSHPNAVPRGLLAVDHDDHTVPFPSENGARWRTTGDSERNAMVAEAQRQCNCRIGAASVGGETARTYTYTYIPGDDRAIVVAIQPPGRGKISNRWVKKKIPQNVGGSASNGMASMRCRVCCWLQTGRIFTSSCRRVPHRQTSWHKQGSIRRWRSLPAIHHTGPGLLFLGGRTPHRTSTC